MDLGRRYAGIDTLTYLTRQDLVTPGSVDAFVTDGNIIDYQISVSADGLSYPPVAIGRWAADHTVKHARFHPATARYVRLTALSTAGGGAAVISELGCGGTNTKPRPH